MKRTIVIATVALIALGGCGKKEKEELQSDGMKCGAGKCGISMASGNSALEKKRIAILKQMRKDDPREACVLNAPDTKTLMECLRDPKTNRITTKCQAKQIETKMKCEAGKCESGKQTEMKCTPGKCGG